MSAETNQSMGQSASLSPEHPPPYVQTASPALSGTAALAQRVMDLEAGLHQVLHDANTNLQTMEAMEGRMQRHEADLHTLQQRIACLQRKLNINTDVHNANTQLFQRWSDELERRVNDLTAQQRGRLDERAEVSNLPDVSDGAQEHTPSTDRPMRPITRSRSPVVLIPHNSSRADEVYRNMGEERLIRDGEDTDSSDSSDEEPVPGLLGLLEHGRHVYSGIEEPDCAFCPNDLPPPPSRRQLHRMMQRHRA